MTYVPFSLLKIISIVIAVIAIIGNALVCHIIVQVKVMRTTMNYIILNLAILDAMIGFLTIYFVFANDSGGVLGSPPILQLAHNRSAIAAEVLCIIERSYWFGSDTTSFLLTIMAYERYKAVVHPLSRLNGAASTMKRLKWILLLAWIGGFTSTIFFVVFVKYDPPGIYCKDVLPSWYHYRFHAITFLVINYLTPAIAMVLFYYRVIRALKLQNGVLGNQPEAQRARAKARKKVIAIIIVVTITFYVCMVFPHTVYVIDDFIGFLQAGYMDFITILMTFNSAFNPLVYFSFLKSFRNGFRRAFKCKQQKLRENSITSFSQRHTSLRNTDLTDNENGSQPRLVRLRLREQGGKFS